jgi:hypothetical protein
MQLENHFEMLVVIHIFPIQFEPSFVCEYEAMHDKAMNKEEI